jgi:hypothetical protein
MQKKVADRPIPQGAQAYSIRQFCAAHNLSVDSYFRLARRGLMPRTMKVGARTLISAEAAAAWRRAREASHKPQRTKPTDTGAE